MAFLGFGKKSKEKLLQEQYMQERHRQYEQRVEERREENKRKHEQRMDERHRLREQHKESLHLQAEQRREDRHQNRMEKLEEQRMLLETIEKEILKKKKERENLGKLFKGATSIGDKAKYLAEFEKKMVESESLIEDLQNQINVLDAPKEDENTDEE